MKKYVDEFYLYNIKTIKELEGKVSGHHFACIGPNGAGKTTVFQVIRRLIVSLPDTQKPDIWIKQGEDSAEMRVKLVNNGDTYYVSEKITKGTRSRIKLWKENGDRRDELTPAQDRLQEIFGSVMDLTPLIDMTGQKQFDYLKKNLNIDTTGYETERKSLAQLRATVKGKKVMLEAIVSEQKFSDDDIKKYGEEKKVDELLAKKTDTTKLSEDKERLAGLINRFEKSEFRIAEIDAEIIRLQKEKKELQDSLKLKDKVKKEFNTADTKLTQALVENNKIDEEVKTVSDHNVMHSKVQYYVQKKNELQIVNDTYADYSDKIKSLDKRFYDRLADLPFGDIYEGLSLVYQPEDEDNKVEEKVGLFLNDLPFNRKQLSYGVMIKCLIKLAVMLNPDGLNFVYISDWDLLDTKNKEDLLQFAEEQGNVQLGIEKVADRTEIAVEFVEVTPKPKKPKK